MTNKNVCRLVVEGKLLGFKVGGSWRFKELDIENWIEEQKHSGGMYSHFSTAEIPQHLANYIDYERMGRDMEMGGEIFTVETGYQEVHIFWAH